MSWLVIHENTGRQVGEHKTKKKAVEQAAEMQVKHEKIGAKHDGKPVGFVIEKVEDPAPAEEEA